MSAWLREPPVHFLLVGALLFALTVAFGEGSQERDDRIVVDAERIEALVERFERAWMRPPTDTELEVLVEDYVTEEILYREALALGLDQDDPVVRRRMRQKMEFLATDLGAREPTEAELADFLRAHPESFERPGRVTFVQVFLDPARSAKPVEERAAATLERLRAENLDPASLADPTLLPGRLVDATSREVKDRFGADFAAAIADASVGEWVGPVPSIYGAHLVRIEARQAPYRPGLDEVRDAVERELKAEGRDRARERFYRSLRGDYEVVLPERLSRPAS